MVFIGQRNRFFRADKLLRIQNNLVKKVAVTRKRENQVDWYVELPFKLRNKTVEKLVSYNKSLQEDNWKDFY